MGQDEYTKLFQYMEKRFDVIDKKLENMATKEDIQQILNRLDSIENS